MNLRFTLCLTQNANRIHLYDSIPCLDAIAALDWYCAFTGFNLCAQLTARFPTNRKQHDAGEIKIRIVHCFVLCQLSKFHIQTDSDAYPRQCHLRVDWRFWHRHKELCLWTDEIWCCLGFYTVDLVARAEQKWSPLQCLNEWGNIQTGRERLRWGWMGSTCQIPTGICMELQLTVKVINKASARHDFRMRIVETCPAYAHVLAINALGASWDRNDFGRRHVIIFDHHNASKDFAPAVIVDVCGDLGEFFQNQSRHQRQTRNRSTSIEFHIFIHTKFEIHTFQWHRRMVGVIRMIAFYRSRLVHSR